MIAQEGADESMGKSDYGCLVKYRHFHIVTNEIHPTRHSPTTLTAPTAHVPSSCHLATCPSISFARPACSRLQGEQSVTCVLESLTVFREHHR